MPYCCQASQPRSGNDFTFLVFAPDLFTSFTQRRLVSVDLGDAITAPDSKRTPVHVYFLTFATVCLFLCMFQHFTAGAIFTLHIYHFYYYSCNDKGIVQLFSCSIFLCFFCLYIINLMKHVSKHSL